jgi:phage antirepressor YoqD-like protein
MLPALNEVKTMSSREIAEFTGKDHSHVLRDIRKMICDLDGDPELDHVVNIVDSRGYQDYVRLPKNLSLTLVAGYSYVIRKRIIDRWQELEAKQTPSLPNYQEALRQLANALDDNQNLQASIAIQAPKAQAFDRIANADGLIGLQAAGKILQQQPNKFIQWLRAEHWIYKRPGGTANLPYSDKSNAGYMTTKAVIVQQPDGSERVREQAVFTPKGIEKIALMLGVSAVSEAA